MIATFGRSICLAALLVDFRAAAQESVPIPRLPDPAAIELPTPATADPAPGPSSPPPAVVPPPLEEPVTVKTVEPVPAKPATSARANAKPERAPQRPRWQVGSSVAADRKGADEAPPPITARTFRPNDMTIQAGFMTGATFLALEQKERVRYVIGLVDGVLVSPVLLGAGGGQLRAYQDCMMGRSAGEMTTALEAQARRLAQPESASAHLLFLQAVGTLCATTASR